MENIEESLLAIGLTQKEASIYIALLQAGKSSLTDIAKTTHIRRTTVYQHVSSLLRRGFISKGVSGKRVFYVPEDPKKILKTFEKGRAIFLEHTPYMEQLYRNARHKPGIRLYEGYQGIIQILSDISSSLTPIDAFFSPEKFFRSVTNKDSDTFLTSIKQNQNILRDLVENDRESSSFIKGVRKYQNDYHKVKLLPKDFPVSVDVLITGNKVAMISFDYMMGVIIENNEIAQFHKSIHHFFWKNIK